MAGMYISALMNTGQNTREQSNITGIQALSICFSYHADKNKTKDGN